ncbi:hypothetical protein U1Q18_051924 [Sarracenia purpurea var. burkii]
MRKFQVAEWPSDYTPGWILNSANLKPLLLLVATIPDVLKLTGFVCTRLEASLMLMLLFEVCWLFCNCVMIRHTFYTESIEAFEKNLQLQKPASD